MPSPIFEYDNDCVQQAQMDFFHTPMAGSSCIFVELLIIPDEDITAQSIINN